MIGAVLAIVCPGQGAQTPGMLSSWLELPGVPDHLDRLSEASGVDLLAHGTTSDADTIRDTAVAQPLIVTTGLLTAEALRQAGAPAAQVTAGHSVGEFTAAAVSGVLSETDAVALVKVRSQGMATASAATPTGMSAVVGGVEDEVTAAIEAAGLTAANVNGAGQIVAAGTLEQLAAFAENPPARARVIPLQVAGAFHTEHMSPAIPDLEAAAAQVSPAPAEITLLSNADGTSVEGAEALSRLVSQVTRPVRWDLCMQQLVDLGVTGMIELAPAGTLANLAKRGMKGVATLALKGPDDLDAAVTFAAEHASAGSSGGGEG